MSRAANLVFLREFARRFHTTGSVLPSSRFLSRALARFVRDTTDEGPRRILEVGPGTGPVTSQIVRAMRPDDRLWLVEINEHFVEVLRRRFDTDPAYREVADRTEIFCGPIEDFDGQTAFDAIVSGLPLNNFAVDDVERILERIGELARPGGHLSFFEYIAIRRFKAAVSGRQQRQRLNGVGRVLGRFLEKEIDRDAVVLNFPPAWVHHVRF